MIDLPDTPLHRKRVAILLMAILMALLTGPATAQEAADDSAQQMHQRIQQLHQLLRERRQARQAHEQRVEGLEAQVERLEADLADAEQRRDERQREVDEAEAAVETLSQTRRRIVSRLTKAAEAAEPVGEAMERRIAAGVPFRREARREAAAAARQSMTQAGEPLRQGEGVAALLELAGQEFELTRATRFWNDPVRLGDGRRVHAQQVRLGLVQQMFVAEDGATLGIAAHDAQEAWQVVLSAEQQRQVRRAAAILQQQRPPSLIGVPLPKPADGGTQ